MAGMTIEGVVEHGRRLGRELGFPTANMAVPDSVTAADGVYYSRAEVDGTLYDAMSNLGSNPSVGGAVRHLETHIFGFGGSLYGRPRKGRLDCPLWPLRPLRGAVLRRRGYFARGRFAGWLDVFCIRLRLCQRLSLWESWRVSA